MKWKVNCQRCGKEFVRVMCNDGSKPKYCSMKCFGPKKTEDELFLHRKKMYNERVVQAPGSDCWGWIGTKDSDGYGRFHSKPKQILAHRFAWEMHFGKIPSGLIVGHHCDSPACSRIDHLYLGTTQHNTMDMVRKNRQAKGSRNGGAKLNEVLVNEINDHIVTGLGDAEIAKKYEVNRRTIKRIRVGLLWKHVGNAKKEEMKNELNKSRIRQGENVNFAKLSDSEVRDIKKALKEGQTGNLIAKKYSVTRATISNIKNGKNWKHIGAE